MLTDSDVVQVGAAFGTAITTIVFNAGLTRSSRAYGVAVDEAGTDAPRPAQLVAYKDAMWAGFAFPMCGESGVDVQWRRWGWGG